MGIVKIIPVSFILIQKTIKKAAINADLQET